MNKNKIAGPVAVTGILMLAVLATISSTNQALAQAKPTSLSLGAFPNKGKVGATTGTLPVSLSGKLTSEGSGVGEASITITGIGEEKHLTTNEFGSYSTFVHLPPGTYTIQAHYAGDSDHESSSATRTVEVTS
jgi:hypothetical protein